ncbi:MAG: hypothetical protein AABN33_19100 [Acidobacteriota bacterium]
MSSNTPARYEAYIERAYEDLFFIHNNSIVAKPVLISAVATFGGQKGSKLKGSKLFLSVPCQFQYAMLVESERRFKQAAGINSKESVMEKAAIGIGALLSPVEAVIQYAHYIAASTFYSNSFYINLGVSCFLHDFGAGAATEIYRNLTQNCDGEKDRLYHQKQLDDRRRKLNARFETQLEAIQGRERVDPKSYTNLEKLKELMKKLAEIFEPWDTACVLPVAFAHPDHKRAKSYSYAPKLGCVEMPKPSAELNRHHTEYHEQCYRKLALASGQQDPDIHIFVPTYLFGRDDGNTSWEDRLNPPPLEDEFRRYATALLENHAKRRKDFSNHELKIRVDGVDIDTMNLYGSKPARVAIEWGARVIELVGQDKEGEFIFAGLFIPLDDSLYAEGRVIGTVKKEGGHRISFAITLHKDAEGNIINALIEIAYSESPLRMLKLALLNRESKLSKVHGVPPRLIQIGIPILATSLTLFFVLPFWLTHNTENNRTQPVAEIQNQANRNGGSQTMNGNLSIQEPAPKSPNGQQANRSSKPQAHKPLYARRGRPATSQDEQPFDVGGRGPSSSKGLNRIYVSIDQTTEEAEGAARIFEKELATNFSVMPHERPGIGRPGREPAGIDAIVYITITQDSAGVTVAGRCVRLGKKSRPQIWSDVRRSEALPSLSTVEDLSRDLVKSLLSKLTVTTKRQR